MPVGVCVGGRWISGWIELEPLFFLVEGKSCPDCHAA